MRITVLGGTGHAGAAVVQEAVKRGHEVRSVSKRPPAEPIEGVEYLHGSLADPQVVEAAVADADAVFEALSGDLGGRIESVFADLARLGAERGFRFGALGGTSSVLAYEGGPRMIDLHPPIEEYRADAERGVWKLEHLKASGDALDWFVINPGSEFGAWTPQRVTGGYRTNPGVLIVDEERGVSHLSAADLALAVLDEFEQPKYRRQGFHAAV